MPFKSSSQAHWMFANKPEMAKQWAAETPDMKSLPKKVSQGKVVEALMRKKRVG